MDAQTVAGPLRRPRLVVLIVAIVVVLGVLWWALAQMRPLPPRVVVMSTGPEGSATAEFAQRYRAALARVGIELRLQASVGSVQNLARLRDEQSGVSVGIAEGGLAQAGDEARIASLGTLFHVPVWFFTRAAAPDAKLQFLAGKRLSIGPEGSGSREFALRLLALNGIDANIATLTPYSPREAADKLIAGDIEAAIMLTSWDSSAVRHLATSTDVRLLGFPRADAYVALYPYLSKLTLPMGVVDMVNNRPATDITLIAAKASLLIRRDLHPAIQYLLLDAATQIHGGPGIFQKAAEFPAAEAIDLPLTDHARTFYTSGRPFLQRYLPFWLAVLAGQLLVLLIPVVGVLYPIVRLAPVIYGWSMRRRIFRLYGELKYLEDELERPGSDGAELRKRLDRLEDRANHIKVPVAFRHLQYTLRDHIGLARRRIG